MDQAEFLRRLCEGITRWTGLVVLPESRGPLTELCERRIQTLGLHSRPEYLRWLARPTGRSAELPLLVGQIANGETYFFRDGPQCAAIQEVLLDLGRKLERPIQVWSAGCSSGEEAYTLAILAAERAVGVKVLGTDLNPGALKAAARARYSEWSLRHVPPHLRERYFVERQGELETRREIRDAVHFAQHNLLHEEPPETSLGTQTWDVILCRNLFIYFAPQAIAQIAGKLVSALVADGWLFLAPAENLEGLALPVRPQVMAGTVAYRYNSPSR